AEFVHGRCSVSAVLVDRDGTQLCGDLVIALADHAIRDMFDDVARAIVQSDPSSDPIRVRLLDVAYVAVQMTIDRNDRAVIVLVADEGARIIPTFLSGPLVRHARKLCEELLESEHGVTPFSAVSAGEARRCR